MDLPAERKHHALSGEFVTDRTRVGNGACEPIEFRDDERVSATNGGECFVEAGSFAVGSSEAVVEIDPVQCNSECFEGDALSSEVLFIYRAPRVADQGARHDRTVTDSHRPLRIFAYQVYETTSPLVEDQGRCDREVSVWGTPIGHPKGRPLAFSSPSVRACPSVERGCSQNSEQRLRLR